MEQREKKYQNVRFEINLNNDYKWSKYPQLKADIITLN